MMKRPLFVVGLTFACTTWVAFVLRGTTALLLSLALVLTGAALLRFRQKLRPLCLVLLSAALALGNYSLYHSKRIEPFLQVDGQTLELQGVILEQSGYGVGATYTLLADFPGSPKLPGGTRVLLRSYGEFPWEPGETVRCLIQAKVPGGSAWYRSRGIALTASVTGTVHPVETTDYRLQQSLMKLRGWMQSNLVRNLPESTAQVAGAMVLGRRVRCRARFLR